MVVSTDRRGIDRTRRRATRRIVLARDQYRCRKDELAAGAPGDAGKGPLPKRPGRVLYRAAADRRNTTQRPSGRAAGKRTKPAEAPPPHCCKRPSALTASSAPPRMAPALGPAMYPGSVPVLCKCPEKRLGLRRPAKTPADRNFQKRSVRQDRPERTADRGRPLVPTATPRRRRRASTHSAQRRRPTSTALPARALFITRGAFRRLIAAGAPTV